MKIGILGAGTWGSALARILNNNGHEVTLWYHRQSPFDEKREHKKADLILDLDIKLTNDLMDVTNGTVLKMDTSLAYEAIGSDQLDVIVVYATDSLLQRYDMVVLEDDLEFFPAYHGAPLVRTSLLEEYPELNDVLNLMADSIDDAYMQAINYQVDVEDRSISDVASEMIDDLGLLE